MFFSLGSENNNNKVGITDIARAKKKKDYKRQQHHFGIFKPGFTSSS